MKGLVYRGPRDIRVEQVPDPKIEWPTDVIVRITSTNICGSDLHMYEGRTDLEPGQVVGHENLGQVIEVGSAVRRIKKGDWVCLPFNVSCGYCRNCERGFTGFCLSMNPPNAGAAYGYAKMGPYPGGQAELLKVPYADFNCLRLPDDAEEKEADYVMLADIWPTGYHATELAGLCPGESVVIYGCGPVGLMAAYSAVVKGASQVMIVDRHPDRLALAESIGAVAIDDSKVDPVERVLELTRGFGADRGCECVGWQAHDPQGHEHPNMTLNNLVKSVRATGGIGVVGVFTQDPKSPDPLMKEGEVAFDVATYFEKGFTVGSGQCNVKLYNRRLRELIHKDQAAPSFIVSHELPLEQGPDAYAHFDARENGWTKVILHPGVTSAREPRARRASAQPQTRRRPSRPTRAAAE
jgi:glutathione-independent formaldehyde dehydrogenase